MKRYSNIIGSALIMSSLSGVSFAHDIWIKADAFQLYPEDQTVFSLDVSRSAEPMIAEANHQVRELTVTEPDGKARVISASYSGKNKEVFEVELQQQGTHHVRAADTQVFLSFYKDKDGERHKIRMKKSEQSKLPAGSKLLKTVEKRLSTETYLHVNGISNIDRKIPDDGLYIQPQQHPATFNVDQEIEFKIFLDGKPLEDAEVSLKGAALGYLTDQEAQEFEKLDDGHVEFKVSVPGQYLLAVETEKKLTDDADADVRSIEKFLTFEIKK